MKLVEIIQEAAPAYDHVSPDGRVRMDIALIGIDELHARIWYADAKNLEDAVQLEDKYSDWIQSKLMRYSTTVSFRAGDLVDDFPKAGGYETVLSFTDDSED
jgi:hypothetical protein